MDQFTQYTEQYSQTMATSTLSVPTRANTSDTYVSGVQTKELKYENKETCVEQAMHTHELSNGGFDGGSFNAGARGFSLGYVAEPTPVYATRVGFGFGAHVPTAGVGFGFGGSMQEGASAQTEMPSNANTGMSRSAMSTCLPKKEFSIDSGEQYERTFIDKSKQNNLIHISFDENGVRIYNIDIATNTLYVNFVSREKFKNININDFAGIVYDDIKISNLSYNEYEATINKCNENGFFEQFEKEHKKKYRFLNHTEFMSSHKNPPSEHGMCWFMNTYCIYISLYQLDDDKEKARVYHKYLSSRVLYPMFGRLT